MAKIIATAGLPYSGKSSWCIAVKLFNHLIGKSCVIISRDAIREKYFNVRYDEQFEAEVLQIQEEEIESFIHTVDILLIDGCHHTQERRNELTNFIASLGYEVEFISMQTTKEECIARAKSKNDDYIIPVIEKKAREWENLD